MRNRLRTTLQTFPTPFWFLLLATFIDRLGGTLIFPFFALYVTAKFGVGMTEAGVLFAIFSVTNFTGGILGGALTDRFGRKSIALFGLVFSALSSVSMGLVQDLNALLMLAGLVGVLAEVGAPARQAMVADLLTEDQRAQGFGLLRVVANVAWILGPTIGGLLAARSYLLLFVLDAVSSLITAAIFQRYIPETHPQSEGPRGRESTVRTILDYRKVLADRVYMSFLLVSMLMLLAYIQLYSTLSVFLRDVHGVPPRGYGLLMSLNATLVVITQFWVTRQTQRYPALLTMAGGAAFYLLGFTLYGFVATFPLFILAMLVITVGEMIVLPVGHALVARFAPEAMRGRYMAIFGLAWTIPAAVGPWAAGIIMDQYSPYWVWYAAGLVSGAAVLGFIGLHILHRDQLGAPETSALE
jgi:MFS family permease